MRTVRAAVRSTRRKSNAESKTTMPIDERIFNLRYMAGAVVGQCAAYIFIRSKILALHGSIG